MSPVPFGVHSEELDDGLRVLAVRGELDLSTAPQLEEPLEEALADEDSLVLVDLSDCEFIDSTGIALLIHAWQRLDGGSEGGGRLVVCSHNHQVQRLLQITGVESSIPLHERRDAALADLRS